MILPASWSKRKAEWGVRKKKNLENQYANGGFPSAALKCLIIKCDAADTSEKIERRAGKITHPKEGDSGPI